MSRFKKIYIEITNSCNLNCDFCPKTSRKNEFMTEELFENILINIKGYSDFIYFHVMGEPLLHPKLGLFLDIAGQYGFKVNITTNGVFIENASDALLINKSVRQVNFSLHSFEGNDNKKSLDEYLDKIFGFIGKAQLKGGPLICLRLWNLSEITNPVLNNIILNRLKNFFSLDFEIEDKVTLCNGIKLSNNVFLNISERFEWPNLNNKKIVEHGFCYGLRDQLAILVDGTVVPCCLDGQGIINLGNINENSIVEILESSRAKEIYNGFSRRTAVEELCQKCGYKSRFEK